MSLLTSKGLRLFNVASNLMKYGGYQVRQHITDLERIGIKWVRPERVSSISQKKSGDRGLEFELKPTEILKMYKESPEFKDVDDKVKPLFTAAFLTQGEVAKIKCEKTMDLVRRHQCDTRSTEIHVATMTATILRLQKQMERYPRNNITKIRLKELIEKRQKFLKRLRVWDYRKFEWVLEKLNLVYYPSPTDASPPHRKDSIRKLVKKKCDSIVNQKLTLYKAELDNQKKKFLKEKAEKLAFIREEEIACGVTPSVTEEEIETARSMAQNVSK